MTGAPVVLFAGGGTGGHLHPGVATAERIREIAPAARCLFATTDRDGDGAWGAAAEGERLALASPRLPRGPLEIGSFLRKMSRSFRDSGREIRLRGVDAVVGLGGYGSVGPGLAALRAGKPTVVLEANVVPGAANRLLTALGATAAVSFEETTRMLRGRGHAIHTGIPLRSGLHRKRRDPSAFGLPGKGPILTVVGGSLGARGLNDRVEAVLGDLAAAGVELLWVTGPAEARARCEAVRRAGLPAAVLPYCEDMGLLYGTSDLLLARSGGSTVAEAAALGVPAVFVPYPHHSDRHQARNAEALRSRGAARVVEEADLTPDRFHGEVLSLLADPDARARMASAARDAGCPGAAVRVARLVLERAAGDGEADPGEEER